MKKKLFCIIGIAIIAVLVLILVTVNVMERQQSILQLPNKLFQIRTYDELETVANNKDVLIEHIGFSYVVENIKAFGESVTFSYCFDSNRCLTELTAYYDFQTDSMETFTERATRTLQGFASLFNISADQYYVYTSSDVYDCNDGLVFERVFAGEAVIELRVRDKDASCWIAKITRTNSDTFLCTVEHYMDDLQFEGMPVNVDLS